MFKNIFYSSRVESVWAREKVKTNDFHWNRVESECEQEMLFGLVQPGVIGAFIGGNDIEQETNFVGQKVYFYDSFLFQHLVFTDKFKWFWYSGGSRIDQQSWSPSWITDLTGSIKRDFRVDDTKDCVVLQSSNSVSRYSVLSHHKALVNFPTRWFCCCYISLSK